MGLCWDEVGGWGGVGGGLIYVTEPFLMGLYTGDVYSGGAYIRSFAVYLDFHFGFGVFILNFEHI